MKNQKSDHALIRETVLGEGLGDVASELRLVDVIDLVSYIRNEQFANVADLVSSSVERYFRPDTLRYGKAADVELNWNSTPSISIDMEFHHKSVSVYFRLLLEAVTAGVEINYLSFANPSSDPKRNTERLMDAIADARLIPFPDSAAARLTRVVDAYL
ncbi:hypothetical protein BH10PSE7_BH10PSE7_30740 [soil metagenome]